MSRAALISSLALMILSLGVLALSPHARLPLPVLFWAKLGMLLGTAGVIGSVVLPTVTSKIAISDLFKNISLTAVSFLIVLLIGEGMTRAIFAHITTTFDYTSYFSQRWAEQHVRENKWGFREREFVVEKSPDVYRIAVIGDSFTYGQGIAEEERFTDLVEGDLNKTQRRYEVLNFGRPGTETIDHLRILREVVMQSNPDFVLLQWYVNDVQGLRKRGWAVPRRFIPSDYLGTVLHQHSAFYYLFNYHWTLLQWNGDDYEQYLRRRFSDQRGKDWEEYTSTISEFISTTVDHGMSVGIVLFPHLENVGKRYKFGYLHERMGVICRKKGIVCVDLLPAFAGYDEDYRRLWVNQFDAHPGPLANRIAAEEIMNSFADKWLSREKLHASNKLVGSVARLQASYQ